MLSSLHFCVSFVDTPHCTAAMSSANGAGKGWGGKDGSFAKIAGVAVATGIAWSIYKSIAGRKEDKWKKGLTYEIEKGDTLFGISQKYGVSVESLKVANGFSDDDIYAGEKLVIPK